MRAPICSALAVVLSGAGALVLATALPDLVSVGSCSTTGRTTAGRTVPVCDAEQVRTIVLTLVGIALPLLAVLFTSERVRGRDALPLRLLGLGVAGLAGGIPAYQRLQDPALPITDMDRTGWTIGMLPLIIGGAICLLLWMITGARRMRSATA